MATTAGSNAVFLDTNVLLTATTPARPLHEAALAVFRAWPNRGIQLCISGQVLREYLVVATRPIEVNGLGLSPEDALFNVSSFHGRLQILAEGEATLRRLERIVRDANCQGKQIHDAHLVATALEHGVARLVTENTGDFHRYSELLEVVALGAPAVG
jgi:predicted nucleic acid-binding protein